MNKQELIKHFEEMDYVSIHQMGKKAFIDLIEQLDEPQKPVVPQFVADWIEKGKKELSLRDLMSRSYTTTEVGNWLGELDKDGDFKNQETFARAVLDGYTVEEEKRYRVRVKVVCFNGCLIFEKINKTWLFSSVYEIDHQRGSHTRKELEDAGFGEVFNSPLFEIEEV